MHLNTFRSIMRKFITENVDQTIKLAQKLAGFLKKGNVLGLIGELGSGKTTFVKGIAKGLRIKEDNVVSPSFVLIREYQGSLPLYHFDLYRLNYLEEVELLGYEDYFYGEGITCVEWAEKIENLLPTEYLKIKFDILGSNKRNIIFYPRGSHFKEMIKRIK